MTRRRFKKQSRKRRKKKRTRGKKGGFFCHKHKNLVKAYKIQLAQSDEEEEIFKKMIDDMAWEEEKIINIIAKYKDEPGVQKIIGEINTIHGLPQEFLVRLAKTANTPAKKEARKNLKDTMLPSKKNKGGKRRRTKKKRRRRRRR